MSLDLIFPALQLRRQIASHARVEMESAPVGFGLAAVKSEAAQARFDREAHFYFADDFAGRPTAHRVRLLLGKADRYIRVVAGLAQWSGVVWRAVPEFQTEHDFDRLPQRTLLRFRGRSLTTDAARVALRPPAWTPSRANEYALRAQVAVLTERCARLQDLLDEMREMMRGPG